MIIYIIATIVALICGYAFYSNRKDLGDSLRGNDKGFSARKIIALQLMFTVFVEDMIFCYLLINESPFAQKNYNEHQNTHLLYVMFTLGFLSLPEIIKLINTIRGNPIKEESSKKEGE